MPPLAEPRNARSSSSIDGSWSRRAATTCRCSSGCATSASSRRTSTSSSRSASPTTSRPRAGPAPACPRADIEALAAAAHALVDDAVRGLQRRGDAGARRRAASASSTMPTATRPSGAGSTRSSRRQVRPLLVPVGLDPAHPFPQVANKSLNFIARLGGKDAFGRRNTIAIVKVPRVLPRVIKLPARGRGGTGLRAADERHPGPPGRAVSRAARSRRSRSSASRAIPTSRSTPTSATCARRCARASRTRHFGQAVRLEVVNTCPDELSEFLLAAVQPAGVGAL